MIKKLDGYLIKTFLGPFFFIFSVLFFIFLIQFAWQKLDDIAGKGLGFLTILELLFYLGINVVQLVLPLAILLGSIMTFGGFGERYELAAIKSTGISLRRAMIPLFVLVCGMALGLFFFADRVMPFSQEKAKTMIFNLARTKPTLNFKEGIFIEGIPTFTLNVDEISGENNNQLKGVFIQRNPNFNENLQTIRAESGILESDSTKRHYLKMQLFNGYIIEEERKNRQKRRAQPNVINHFDTLNQYFDISTLIETKDDTLGRHYTFLHTTELKKRIDSVEKIYDKYYSDLAQRNINGIVFQHNETEKHFQKKDSLNNLSLPWDYDTLKPSEQKKIINQALNSLSRHRQQYESHHNDIKGRIKFMGKHKLHYQRSFAYAFTCIVFFLVGAPLGAIVKKGGIGMPVVISIIVFALYYIVNIFSENATKSGSLDGYISAWMANLVFFPIGIWLTILANKDSDLLTSNIYIEKITKFSKSLIKSNTYIRGVVNFLEKLFPSDKEEQQEHERYQ